MSVIAIGNVPLKMNVITVVKLLARQIQGYFEAINFGAPRNGFKVCYLKLSPKLDPLQVIERINMKKKYGTFHPQAFLPKRIPYLQVSRKPRHIPVKIRRKMNLRVFSPRRLVEFSHGHIIREMQMKYAGLNGRKKDFGEATYKKLIQEVGRVVYQRLVQIMKDDIDKIHSTFLLSKAYRKKHPHFGDFQLILSTLHQIQDAEGKPRLYIQENELTSFRVTTTIQIMKDDIDKIHSTFLLSKAYRKKHPHFGDFQLILSTLHQIQDAEGKPRLYIQENELTSFRVTTTMIDNIPVEKVQEACNTYIEKITDKVLEHVKNLKMEAHPEMDPIEAAAKIKVREQIVKLTPYLPDIIKQVVNKQFIPDGSSCYTVLIYGEPTIPNKELTKPWLRRHRAITVMRDPNLFNLLTVRVPRDALAALLAADGTLVGGSKMTIRPCDVPTLKICVSLYKEESEKLSDELDGIETNDAVDDHDNEWTEDW